jgi:hypothetical protein
MINLFWTHHSFLICIFSLVHILAFLNKACPSSKSTNFVFPSTVVLAATSESKAETIHSLIMIPNLKTIMVVYKLQECKSKKTSPHLSRLFLQVQRPVQETWILNRVKTGYPK